MRGFTQNFCTPEVRHGKISVNQAGGVLYNDDIIHCDRTLWTLGQIFYILLYMGHLEGISLPARWLYVIFGVKQGLLGQRGLFYGH